MSVAQFLKETPIWLWVLLVFFIRRGLSALSDRSMRIEQLFLLPLLLLVWGVCSVFYETAASGAAIAVMLPGLGVGIMIGWLLWRSQPKLRHSRHANHIIRPGTPLTLILILLIFAVKFTLTAALTIWPELFYSSGYNLLFGLLSGVLAGLFWGGMLKLFLPWYRTRSSGDKVQKRG